MTFLTKTNYSLVSVTALNPSGTVCAYAEVCNRSGVDGEDIGNAVLTAIARMIATAQLPKVGSVLVSFSHDT